MAENGFKAALEDLEKGAHTGSEIHGLEDQHDDPASSHPSVAALRERFGEGILRHEVMAGDEHVVFIRPDRALEILRWLKESPEHAYDLLADLTAVDYGGERPLQVVYQLWSTRRKLQLRVKAEIPLRALEIDSVAPLWSTADWLERECYDMFGITFHGHPDLRRILMPENYAEGHPLRKDFPLRGRFSRAEQTRRALAMDVEDFYVPSELDVMKRHSAASAGTAGAGPSRAPSGPTPDSSGGASSAGGAGEAAEGEFADTTPEEGR